jgi:hypothetical protein
MTPYVFIASASMPKLMMVYTNRVAPGRAQTNPNGPNSKFQTIDPFAIIPAKTRAVQSGFAKRCHTAVEDVLVIEFWKLGFICNLVLEIWDLIV